MLAEPSESGGSVCSTRRPGPPAVGAAGIAGAAASEIKITHTETHSYPFSQWGSRARKDWISATAKKIGMVLNG